MNKKIYNLLFIIFIVVLLYFLWYFTKQFVRGLGLPTKQKNKEAFIPKIVKETYRPIERNVRKTYEGFYDKTSTDISNLFRKFGIL